MSPGVVAELRSYVGLGGPDTGALLRLRPVAEPRFPSIADEFYARVRMHEGAFAILADEAQAMRLHASLQTWLGDLLCGVYDDAWADRQANVGRVHVRVGLEPRYMVTAMGGIRGSLQGIASEVMGNAATGTRRAVGRVCDLSLAIMLEGWQERLRARAERMRARARSPMAQTDSRAGMLGDALAAGDVVLFVFDGEGRALLVNERAAELTGYGEDELEELDCFATLFGERAGEMRNTFLVGASRTPLEAETEVRTRAGKSRVVRWRASLSTAPNDAGPAIVLVGMDVTRERELERRARQNERLAAAGALAAGLAHEIRNPLNGASLHVSVLDRTLARLPGVPPVALEATEVLRAEIKRLGALVTDFLEVARPKPLLRAECDLNEIARSVVALLGPEARSRRVDLLVEAFPFPVVASVDAERIKQVLVNLVRNGMEAVAEGGHVRMRVRRLPRDVEIDVVDDGPGVAERDAPIFDAFYTTKDRGTGLGLSIVRRIVNDHGGEVSFTSKPGATVFTARLPGGARPL